MKIKFGNFITLFVLSFASLGIGQSCASGQNAYEKYPVPKFDRPTDTNEQREIAEVLRLSYRDLHKHLCNKPNPVSESWKAKYRELVIQMIVAQHKTVWATAGDFKTVQEGNEIAPFFKLQKEMRSLLEKTVLDNPNYATEINGIKNRFDTRYNELQSAINNVDFGKSIFTVYALRTILAQLEEDLSSPVAIQVGIQNRFTSLRDAAFKAMTKAHERIYFRVIDETNSKRLPNGAKPFVLYIPDKNDPYFGSSWDNKELRNAILNSFFKTIGKPYKPFPTEDTDFYQTYSYKAFDELVGKALLGDCEEGVNQPNFSLTVETTPNTPNEDEEMQERLKEVQENWLPRLAPGTGVARIYLRNARNEIWNGKMAYLEIRDAGSGKLVEPLKEPVYSSHENFVLPQGTYQVTPVMHATHPWKLDQVEFQVRGGAITEVALGGSSVLGRVEFKPQAVTSENSGDYIYLYEKDEEQKWFDAANGSEQYLDMPPGKYRLWVQQGNAMYLWTESFIVEAGKTVTLRPINRGRIATRKGDAPAGTTVAVSTLSSDQVRYINFDHNEFIDVPAGTYDVFIGLSKQRIVVKAGETIFVKP